MRVQNKHNENGNWNRKDDTEKKKKKKKKKTKKEIIDVDSF
jgi:hypothetical protein